MKLISVSALLAIIILAISCDSTEKAQPTIDANSNLDSLLKIYPDSVPILVLRGNKMMEEYDLELALRDAAKAFRLDTNNIDARLLYAEVISRRNSRTPAEVSTAQRLYKHIIKKQPKNLKALVGLASTYSYQRDYNTSFEYINKALRIDKHYRDAYVLKGANYMNIGDRDLAKSSYETAIQQDPEFFAAYLILGQIYQNENNPRCLTYYQSAAALKPEVSGELIYYLAYCEQEYGDLEKAIELYRKMAADEDEAKVVLGLFHQGWIKQNIDKDLDSAIYFYESGLDIEPRHIESWHNLGMCYDLTGKKTLALQSFSSALNLNPDYEMSRVYADSIRFK